MEWTEVTPLIVGLIGAITGLLALFKGRNKEKADVAKAITEAAGELVEDYQSKARQIEEDYKGKLAQIEERMAEQDKKMVEQGKKLDCQELKIEKQAKQIEIQAKRIREQADQIKALEVERDEILTGVMELCKQVHALGQQPVWMPEVPEN
jgi:chromosome segregation ATPase